MKICYLWLDRFRNFENQGFNFSSNTKFHFDRTTQVLSKTSIPSLPPDFFSTSEKDSELNTNRKYTLGEIIEVTGIIGRNGAGKSNVLDALLKSIKGAKSTMPCDFFLITEIDSKFECHVFFPNNRVSEIKSDFEIEISDYDGSLKNLKAVFFSNVFDGRENLFSNDISDISLNNRSRFSANIRRNDVSDFEQQINFIQSKYFDRLNIEIPEKVQFGSRIWYRRNSSSLERILKESYNDFREYQSRIRSRLRDIKPENRFFLLLKNSFFIKLTEIISDPLIKESVNPFEELFRVLNNENRTENSLDIGISWLFDFLQKHKFIIEYNPENRNRSGVKLNEFRIIEQQNDFIIKLQDKYSEIEIEYHNEGKRSKSTEYFNLNYNHKISRDFIQEFAQLFSYDLFFDLDWIGISSGHKAYLNMFSSIYKELRLAKSDNLLLCIDEGDLYLHPKWQTEFFSKLITILPHIFPNSIQLLITSHSPFLLADLPKQCVTIIEPKIDGQNFISDGYRLESNTFGGNIYTLYKEPFFLENKRMSDFAASKVNYIVDEVEKDKMSATRKKELFELSSLIGDKVISHYLHNLIKDA